VEGGCGCWRCWRRARWRRGSCGTWGSRRRCRWRGRPGRPAPGRRRVLVTDLPSVRPRAHAHPEVASGAWGQPEACLAAVSRPSAAPLTALRHLPTSRGRRHRHSVLCQGEHTTIPVRTVW